MVKHMLLLLTIKGGLFMNQKTIKIATIGLMAALAYISFTFLQIKVPTPGGFTSFHLGNTFCVLAALLIGGIPGGIAGAIGMGIGDILDPTYVTVAPKTIILKFMIGIITGFVAFKLCKLHEQTDTKTILKCVILSTCAGMLFNIIGEPIFSYFYTSFVLGSPSQAAMKLAQWNGITTSVNAIMTVICSSALYMIIQPRLRNTGMLKKLAPTKK